MLKMQTGIAPMSSAKGGEESEIKANVSEA